LATPHIDNCSVAVCLEKSFLSNIRACFLDDCQVSQLSISTRCVSFEHRNFLLKILNKIEKGIEKIN